MRYKIFYGDGSTYSDYDGAPCDAPKRNVQVIAVEDQLIGRRLERLSDFYVWVDHGWRGCDQFGMYDYLIDPGVKIVLFGRSVSDDEWRALWDVVVADDYLPPKSARAKTEGRT